MHDTALMAIAALLSTLGVAGLWLAWRHQPGRHWAGVIAAWAAIAAALALYGKAGGGERGIALGILGLVATALGVLGATAIRRYAAKPAPRTDRRAALREAPAAGGPHVRLASAMSALGLAVLAGAATLALSLLVYTASFALAAADRVALAFLLWPLLWSLACAELLLARRSRGRSAVGMILLGLASLAGRVAFA